MSDYISREDAVDELQVKVFHNLTDEYYGTMQVLTELPAADVALVVHGKWIKGRYTEDDLRYNDWSYKCDKCGRVNGLEENYCPNCGAKMDKE